MEAKVHKACESWIYLGKNIKGKIISLIKLENDKERRKKGEKCGKKQVLPNANVVHSKS